MQQRSFYATGQLYDIPLANIHTNPDQPRKSFDTEAMSALKQSMQVHGLLNPVAVMVGEDGQLCLVAGERRLRAARALGWLTIPARVVEGNMDDLALMENMIREDLNPMERAMSMQRYLDTHTQKNANGRRVKVKQNDLAKILGMAKNSVAEILSLNRLPEDIKAVVLHDKRYPLNKLRVIARTRDAAQQREKFARLRQLVEQGTSAPAPASTASPQPFDREKRSRRLKGIAAELHQWRCALDRKELKQLKTEYVALRDELEATLYKISDEISMREFAPKS